MKPKYILGFMNYCSHDPGACIVKTDSEGNFLDYIFVEEGFLSRKKKSYQFPLRSIYYCLNFFEIKLEEISAICVDYMDAKRLHRTSDNYRLLVGDYIRANLKIADNTEVIFCESHHMAHAYSTYLASGLKSTAVLVVDGLGSNQQTHSFFKADENGITHIDSQYGTGIGTLYTLITRSLGFDSGEEGKTMGLAPYGKGNHDQDRNIPNLVGIRKGNYCDYTHIMNRNPSPSLKIDIQKPQSKEEIYNPYFSRLAFNLQKECEESILYLAKKCMAITGSDNLCLAGGVALNCVANERVSDEVQAEFFVQPASGDTGIPIGLALYGSHKLSKKLARIDEKHSENYKTNFYPYSSDSKNYINNEMEKILKISPRAYINKFSVELDEDKVVDLLESDFVGAIYDGGIEIGPRALGHRSFIASARHASMKEVMNKKIKHREAYRPFAPMVMEEEFSKYFESLPKQIHKYMLGAPSCRELAKIDTPAVVHVDGSARVQSMGDTNCIARKILERYKSRTGIALLINTSFNDNNEPIVFSWLDALICFLRTNCDFLVIDNKIVLRRLIPDIQKTLNELEILQSQWLKYYTRKAIKELTSIGNPNLIGIREFSKINASLSSANRKECLHIKLLKFLDKCIASNKAIVTDIYHERLLQKIDSLFPSSKILKSLGPLNIVNDDLRFLDSKFIDSDKYEYLLYNMSTHVAVTANSFYKSNDKLLDWNILIDYPQQHDPEADVELILNSYETDPLKSIGDWFKSMDCELQY